jgi:hypothetical protein
MQDAYQQAQQFEYRLKSYLDQPNSSVGQWLRQEIIHLMDDIEMQKNPRTIEARVQGMKRTIEGLQDASIMDNNDQDDLKDRCDDLIQLLRKLN